MTSKLYRAVNNAQYTENGAVTNRSTLNPLLDLFAMGAAARGRDITHLFADAMRVDHVLAIKALFYIRDVRGGQGERNTFRSLLDWLYKNDNKSFTRIVRLVPEYGRWDDIIKYVDHDEVANLVDATLERDMQDMYAGKPISLLAKWMPSENASSKVTRRLARKWMTSLGITAKQYREMLSNLRSYLNIVERYMSSGEWTGIKYAAVPSKAMANYRKAFSKHDATGFVAYLESVKKGEKKINASALFPYELFEKLLQSRGGSDRNTLELQWNALPNYVEDDDSSAIVVADVSGSMSGRPMAVSVSLALYFAERSKGPFKDTFITFSNRPAFHKIVGNTIYDKMMNIKRADWDMNTNFQAVFDLILSTAIRYNLKDADLPRKIFVVSDMEFDSAGPNTNFETIKRKYANAGYEMPQLVFWNVNSRKDNVPAVEGDNVFLVSGCSPSIFKNALNSRATKPEDLMLEVLNSPRYDAVGAALLS